jgi:hypothetical protein
MVGVITATHQVQGEFAHRGSCLDLVLVLLRFDLTLNQFRNRVVFAVNERLRTALHIRRLDSFINFGSFLPQRVSPHALVG